LRKWSWCLILFCVACGKDRLRVEHMVTPEYPIRANAENIQGTVRVDIMIGADGKVFWAKGSGAHPLLVEAAENNVRQWVFGPFPPVAEFPIYHTVTFVYKLEGPPLFVALHPVIRTSLPDRVEIQARSFESDYHVEELPGTKTRQDQK